LLKKLHTYLGEEEEKDIMDHKEPKRSNAIPSFAALPFLPIFLGAYLVVIRPRLRKSVKKINGLSDK
jgi:hypothetical protein